MADVKVCDRCGKRLTEDRSIFSLTPNRYTLNVTLFKQSRSYSGIPSVKNTAHDLCIDCTGKLAEWMECVDTEV